MKNIRKLQVIMSLIVVVMLLLSCTALTLQRAVHERDDYYYMLSGVTGDFEDYIQEYSNYGVPIIRNEYEYTDIESLDTSNALGIIPSFYLAHEDLHPYITSEVSFHSMLMNSEGETVAEYQPCIVFEKGDDDVKNHDVRVLLLGGEFAEEYCRIEYSDAFTEYKNDGVRTLMTGTYEYGRDITGTMDDAIEVDGTCDENYVYLDKLTWYDFNYNETYGFIPENNETDKGKTEFEEWFEPEKENSIYSLYSISRFIVSNETYNKQAKELCERSFEELNTESFMLGDFFDKGLITTTIQRVSMVSPYSDTAEEEYFYSCAYVFHPLSMAMNDLSVTYVVATAIAIGLIIFICLLLQSFYKKNNGGNNCIEESVTEEPEEKGETVTEAEHTEDGYEAAEEKG